MPKELSNIKIRTRLSRGRAVAVWLNGFLIVRLDLVCLLVFVSWPTLARRQ